MPLETPDPPLFAGEREMLRAWIEYHRSVLAYKCDGLSAEQLRQRAVPPSTLSLLGLLRHMTEVERSWFQRVVGGQGFELALLHSDSWDWDACFDEVDSADPEEAFAQWREACEVSRAAEAAVESLDASSSWRDDVFSLRWILVHMIEEYARHNGHADLIRQRIDGQVGDGEE